MRFKQYIEESVIYGKKTEKILSKYKKGNFYAIFSDSQKPREERLHKNIPMKGIIAYPVKHLLKKIRKDLVFEIPYWATSEYIVIVEPKEDTIIFDTRLYGKTFKEDIERLKKWYLKHLPPTSKKNEKRFDTFVYNAKNKDLNKFSTLLDVMKQMRSDIDVLLDDFFKVYKISALYTSKEDDSFMTYNPEIIFFNYKNMNIIAAEKNI